MSAIFECQNTTVWEPGLVTGHMFYEQLKSLERLAGCPCGLIPTMDDTYEIQQEVLSDFLQSALSQVSNTNSQPMLRLAVGPLEIGIALYNRLTGTFPTVLSRFEYIIQGASDFNVPLESSV